MGANLWGYYHQHVTRMLLREHKHKPINGNFLFVARQTTFYYRTPGRTPTRQEGVPLNTERRVAIKSHTRASKSSHHDFLTDASLLSFFSNATSYSLDVSSYENAAIIRDLNLPAPSDLNGRFDFIYNGSCLDNVFNPAQAIINLSSMLSTTGRILHLKHGTRYNNPLYKF
jgi:hypothetical protein